jgi:hypothetical protein
VATINQLALLQNVSSGDQLAVYSSVNGDARRLSIASLLSYFQQTFASPEFATQLVVPTTGFNIAITQNGNNAWLLMQPTGTLATGTITLPLNTVASDGQEVLVTSTQIITSLSISLNGASAVNGAPTTMAANTFFKLRFYQPTNSWYRVG